MSAHVNFKDGGRGRTLGKGNILKPDPPNLQEVRFVEGLVAKLISVS